MKKELLEKIGAIFTQKWLKEQDNSKLEGFTESAERCLIGQQDYMRGRKFAGIFGLAAICLLPFEQLLSGGIFLIAVGLKIFAERVLYEGLTSQKVAQDWQPLRGKLLRHGVISQSLKIFEDDYEEVYGNFIPQDIIRGLLVRAFDELMNSHLSNLKKAQREGFPKKEEEILSEIEILKELPRELGIQMSFPQHDQLPTKSDLADNFLCCK